MKIKSSIVVAAAAGTAWAPNASAADLPVKAPAKIVADPWYWTGFYVGGHLGAAWQRGRTTGAYVDDPGNNWKVGFRLGGKDITNEVVQKGGFVFIKNDRLWPNANKRLQLTLTCKNPKTTVTDANSVAVSIGLLANPARRDKLTETVTIHASTVHSAAKVASIAE